MFDYEAVLKRALDGVGDSHVALGAVHDLPQRVCVDLLSQQRAHALIADSAELAQQDSTCAGWWVDRERDQIHLRQGVASTLLIAGVDRTRRVGVRLLLESRLKGVRRLVTTDHHGDVVEDLQVEASLLERIDSSTRSPRLNGPTYEDAFEEMYGLVGDRLRLRRNHFASNRAAIFVGSLGPGGAERQCAYTSVGVGTHYRWEPHVVCDSFDPPADFFKPYVEGRGVSVVRVDESPAELFDPEIQRIIGILGYKYPALNFGNIFIQIVRYAALLRSLSPALIHTWMDYCNTLAGSAAVMVGVPAMVFSCRSLAPDHFRIFQPYMRPAYRALLQRRPVVMLNNSRAGAKDYARWLGIPEQDVDVIHNGFEFPEPALPGIRLGLRARYAIPESAKVVGSILRFSEEKQPDVLIDMARELHGSDPSLRFLFFGGGVMLEETRSQVAAQGLSDIIHLPGVTNAPWEALSAMDIFVLASRMEGLPNVLVEAQASGLPVVCARVGGMCETLVENETGIAVERASSDALAAAVRGILKDDVLRARMSNHARAHARKVFGLSPMIEETLQAYARAEAQAGGRSTTQTAR